MDNCDILEKYFTDESIQEIWGTMYGGYSNTDECITTIPKKEFKLTRNADEFIYIWGWPGPDANFYKLSDYGKTWAFTREELPQYKTYEEVYHNNN